MEKLNVSSTHYVESENRTVQGKRNEIDIYLKRGYHVKEERNGFWVLTKPAEVLVDITDAEENKTINMKQDVLDCYKKSRISKKVFNQFEKDIKDGKIRVKKDNETSRYYVEKARE